MKQKPEEVGKMAPLLQVQFVDKCKPHRLRTSGIFVTFIGKDRAAAIFGKSEMVDADISFLVREVGNFNGLPKVKGEMVLGHHAADALANLTAPQPAAEPAKK